MSFCESKPIDDLSSLFPIIQICLSFVFFCILRKKNELWGSSTFLFFFMRKCRMCFCVFAFFIGQKSRILVCKKDWLNQKRVTCLLFDYQEGSQFFVRFCVFLQILGNKSIKHSKNDELRNFLIETLWHRSVQLRVFTVQPDHALGGEKLNLKEMFPNSLSLFHFPNNSGEGIDFGVTWKNAKCVTTNRHVFNQFQPYIFRGNFLTSGTIWRDCRKHYRHVNVWIEKQSGGREFKFFLLNVETI